MTKKAKEDVAACYPRIDGDMVFRHDNCFSEPIAIQNTGKCNLCGKTALVWEVTDSEWEYGGTAMCASCLSRMAQLLLPPNTIHLVSGGEAGSGPSPSHKLHISA